MSKEIILGGFTIMLGLVTIAIGLFLGLVMLADAGYNSGSLNQMLDGGVILVLFVVVGSVISSEGIKLMQLNPKNKDGGKD